MHRLKIFLPSLDNVNLQSGEHKGGQGTGAPGQGWKSFSLQRGVAPPSAEEAEDCYQWLCSGAGRGHDTAHTTTHNTIPRIGCLYFCTYLLLMLYITCLLLFVKGEKRLVRKYTHLSTTLGHLKLTLPTLYKHIKRLAVLPKILLSVP